MAHFAVMGVCAARQRKAEARLASDYYRNKGMNVIGDFLPGGCYCTFSTMDKMLDTRPRKILVKRNKEEADMLERTELSQHRVLADFTTHQKY